MQEGHSEEARQGGGADVVETDVMNYEFSHDFPDDFSVNCCLH